MPRAGVTILDSSGTVIARGIADEQGRFSLQVFAGLPYRLHALGTGNSAGEAVSAAQDIQPGGDPLSLRLTLAPPGNSMLDERRGGAERQAMSGTGNRACRDA
ncbi:MAG: hypothetical protein ABUS51_07645 [Acidobacteriota bacterium]